VYRIFEYNIPLGTQFSPCFLRFHFQKVIFQGCFYARLFVILIFLICSVIWLKFSQLVPHYRIKL